MGHDEPWQVFGANGEAIVGEARRGADFTDELTMGASHVWCWRRCDDSVEILLQQRAFTKSSWPGYYDISAAGHIDAGESPAESAVRECHEELGLEIDIEKLYYIFSLRTPLAKNEIDHVYVYEIKGDSSFRYDDGEVEKTEWVAYDEFLKRVARPEQYNLLNQGNNYFTLLISFLNAV